MIVFRFWAKVLDQWATNLLDLSANLERIVIGVPPNELGQRLRASEQSDASARELAAAREQIATTEAALQASREQLEAIQAQLHDTRQRFDEMEQATAASQSASQHELQKTLQEFETVERQLRETQQRLTEVEQATAANLTASQHELSKTHEQLEAVRAQLRDTQQRFGEMEHSLSSDLEASQDELWTSQKELKVTQTQLYETRQHLERAEQSVSSLKEEVTTTRTQLLHAQQRVTELEHASEQRSAGYERQIVELRGKLDEQAAALQQASTSAAQRTLPGQDGVTPEFVDELRKLNRAEAQKRLKALRNQDLMDLCQYLNIALPSKRTKDSLVQHILAHLTQ